uniref:C-type lectin domain-containing protein n=1 Tax=Panagrolaimus sp. PS1159 TaxID=55785 RepID=A0AC35FRS2_9BILA
MLFSFFWVLLFFVSSVSSTCSSDGIEWLSSCYYFQTNSSQFLNAEENCIQNFGGHLASIHNGFTNAFLSQHASLLTNDSLWIGATDLMLPGNFSWTDGTPFDFNEFSNFKNGTGKDCVALHINGKWQKVDCYASKFYICETADSNSSTVKPSNPTTTFKSTTTNTAIYECSGWSYFENSCYKNFKDLHYPWKDAEDYCKNLSGSAHLVSIHSKREMQFLIDHFVQQFHYYWIGLFSSNNGSTWKWSDNTPVDYTNWKDGMPVGSIACVNFDYDGTWANDANCTDTPSFFCKKRAFNFLL